LTSLSAQATVFLLSYQFHETRFLPPSLALLHYVESSMSACSGDMDGVIWRGWRMIGRVGLDCRVSPFRAAEKCFRRSAYISHVPPCIYRREFGQRPHISCGAKYGYRIGLAAIFRHYIPTYKRRLVSRYVYALLASRREVAGIQESVQLRPLADSTAPRDLPRHLLSTHIPEQITRPSHTHD